MIQVWNVEHISWRKSFPSRLLVTSLWWRIIQQRRRQQPEPSQQSKKKKCQWMLNKLLTLWNHILVIWFCIYTHHIDVRGQGCITTSCAYLCQFVLERNKKDILHKMTFYDAVQMLEHSEHSVHDYGTYLQENKYRRLRSSACKEENWKMSNEMVRTVHNRRSRLDMKLN